jgi:hypothetical protein
MLVILLLCEKLRITAGMRTEEKFFFPSWRQVIHLAALPAEGTISMIQTSTADAANELTTGTLKLQQFVVIFEANTALHTLLSLFGDKELGQHHHG